MSSDFVPTHVRCIRAPSDGSFFKVGNTYKIKEFKQDWLVIIVSAMGSVIRKEELKLSHTGSWSFCYVGPPATIGEPK